MIQVSKIRLLFPGSEIQIGSATSNESLSNFQNTNWAYHTTISEEWSYITFKVDSNTENEAADLKLTMQHTSAHRATDPK